MSNYVSIISASAVATKTPKNLWKILSWIYVHIFGPKNSCVGNGKRYYKIKQTTYCRFFTFSFVIKYLHRYKLLIVILQLILLNIRNVLTRPCQFLSNNAAHVVSISETLPKCTAISYHRFLIYRTLHITNYPLELCRYTLHADFSPVCNWFVSRALMLEHCRKYALAKFMTADSRLTSRNYY